YVLIKLCFFRVFFFFSSRRRHTISKRDWSSDVCSSDLKHMYAQLIDDVNGFTLVSASTKDKELDVKQTSNVEAASKVGKLLAQRAKEKGLTSVVFDRAGYLYHGRVKALAEAAREEGIEFKKIKEGQINESKYQSKQIGS